MKAVNQNKESGSGKYKIALLDTDHQAMSRNARVLQSIHAIEIVSETTTYSIAASVIERHRPDYVFVVVEDYNFAVIDKIKNASEKVIVVALGDAHNSELLLRAFRAGADEFLDRNLRAEDIIEVLDRLHLKKSSGTKETQYTGEIIAFAGSRGGCGATSLACNYAYQLSQRQDTILLDLHFNQGDLSLYFNVQPSLTLADLGQSLERIDDALLESIIYKHPHGLHLLLQPFEEDPFFMDFETVRLLIRCLQKRYQYVVLDLGTEIELAMYLHENIQQLYLVVKQDIPSAFLASKQLQRLNQVWDNMKRLDVVVNAYNRTKAVSLQRIVKVLNKRDLLTIRDDEKAMLGAMNQGAPIQQVNKWCKIAKDIDGMIDLHVNHQKSAAVDEPAVQTQEKRRLMGSLLPQIRFGSTS